MLDLSIYYVVKLILTLAFVIFFDYGSFLNCIHLVFSFLCFIVDEDQGSKIPLNCYLLLHKWFMISLFTPFFNNFVLPILGPLQSLTLSVAFCIFLFLSKTEYVTIFNSKWRMDSCSNRSHKKTFISLD